MPASGAAGAARRSRAARPEAEHDDVVGPPPESFIAAAVDSCLVILNVGNWKIQGGPTGLRQELQRVERDLKYGAVPVSY